MQVPVSPNPGDWINTYYPFPGLILFFVMFIGLLALMKKLGERSNRRELAGRLDQLKALAGAIERARSDAVKLDIPMFFHPDDVYRHVSSQLVVMPGEGDLLFEPVRFAAGTGSTEPSTISVSDPETGWGGQIRIDSSGIVILTREYEYGAQSIQYTRPFPPAIVEGAHVYPDSSCTLAN